MAVNAPYVNGSTVGSGLFRTTRPLNSVYLPSFRPDLEVAEIYGGGLQLMTEPPPKAMAGAPHTKPG